MNIKGMSVANLLREIIVAVNYEEYLKESQKDWTARFVACMSFPRTIAPTKRLLQMGECPGASHLRNGEPIYQEPICISGNRFVSTSLAVGASRADFQSRFINRSNYQT
jgi:hypothetical protein